MKGLPATELRAWRELGARAGRGLPDFHRRALDRLVARRLGVARVSSDSSVDWAQILPITTDGNAVLVRQYRHGAQRVTLEMPGGLIDAGEDPATAALRECLEETGYRAREALSLGAVSPNPALFTNRLHCFYATGVEPERAVQNTGTEVTEVVLVPVADLEGLLVSGEIDHALVAATMWRYLRLHWPR